MRQKTLAWLVLVIGAVLMDVGVALIYLPAGLIAAGVDISLLGLMGIQVEEPR